jgi:hypothetical protein
MAAFTQNQIDQFESGSFQVVDIVDVFFWDSVNNSFSDEYNFSTSSYDKAFMVDGVAVDYVGGLMLSMTSTNVTAEMTRRNISFQLSGLSMTLVEKVQQAKHSGAPFTLYKVVLNPTGTQVDDAVVVYKGAVQSGGFEINPVGSAVTLNGSHALYDFNRTNNVKSQHDDYVGWCKRNGISGYDKEFIGIDDETDVPWGGV